jgi:hypothetical protein
VLLAAGLLGGVARPAFADTPGAPAIVCWTDDQGQRNCGDHVPPQYAKTAHDVYNKQGIEVQSVPREETPEEQAARLQRAQQAEQEAQAARAQAAHDAYLLESYTDISDLEAERDGRLQYLDTRVQLAEKAVADSEAALAGLQARVDAARDKGEDPDPHLLKQLSTFEASRAENADALAQLKQQRDDTAARFDHDIKRYLALHSQEPARP